MKSLIRMVCLAALVATSAQVQAGVITTNFAGGSGANGNMFNVQTFGSALEVTGLTVHKRDTGTSTLEVYTRSGTYVGFESIAAGWTLVSSTSVTGASGSNGTSNHGVGTFVDVTDFILAPSSITGLYITFTPLASMNYTNGSFPMTNADLALTLGTGKAYGTSGFNGATAAPRYWNGSIHYNVVPEPASFAIWGIGALGMGLVVRRKKKITA